MKLSSFLIFVCAASLMASKGYAQETKLTINMNNVRVIDVLNKIEESSEFYFLLNQKLIDVDRKVNIVAEEESIDRILDKVFANTPVRHDVKNRLIVLTTEKTGFNLETVSPALQQNTVTGTVVDENGEPMPGVNILVKGTTTGTFTDANGKYTLSVPNADAVLEFTFIGYASQEIKIGGGRSVIDVSMKPESTALEEIVVVGYGTQKKSDLTGAISQIKAKDLPITGNMSLGQMMSGKAPGMQVSLQSSQPGGGVWIQIRGNASGGAGNSGPLFVIDGFPISTGNMEPGSGNRYQSGNKSPLNNLNPSDIESIEVLKDASSTSIYGSRSSNGVVLITTKRGKNQEKPTVQYSASISYQKRAKQIEMLNAPDHMIEANRVFYEEWLNDNRISPYGSTDPSTVKPFSPKYSESDIANAKTTDWLGAIEREGFMHQHNVSIRGGTKTNSYYISGNFFDQKGVIKHNGIKRYTGRANFDQKLGKYIKTGVNINVSQVNSDNVALGGGQNENAGVIRAAMNANPTLPIYNKDGSYALDPDQGYLPNPVSLFEITDQSNINQILGNFHLTVTPIKGLDIKMNAGFQQEKGERNTYLPKSTLYGYKADGSASRAYSGRNSNLFDITASYNKDFAARHHLSAMVGYSYQHFSNDGFSASNSKFITDAFLWNNLQAGENKKPGVSSLGGEHVLGSVFSRVSYNYDDRYLLTATMRGDASSKFAENHKWGYFPSVAFAWRMINENFMKQQEVLSDLKWRFSWGQTGNANIGNNALALYTTGYDYMFGGESNVGVAQSQLANPGLKWETTSEFNVGLDFGFLHNRITGTMEFFSRRVSDLLAKKELMYFYPISSVMSNIGIKGSKGFELGLNTRNIVGEFNWSTDVVFSLYRDRWIERDPNWKKRIYESEHDMLNPYYLYVSDGLIQPNDMNLDGTCKLPHMPNAKPGMIKYKDLHGRDENGNLTDGPDGKLDDADIEYLGTATSKFYLGFGNTFIYKGFDLNIFFYGYFGRKLANPAYSNWYVNKCSFIKMGVNMANAVKERWTHDNLNGKYPTSIQNPYERNSDFWLENANFLRCKNITLGYTVLTNKVISKLRVYGDVQNPFLFTKYSGVDPEADSMAAYPTQLTVSFGVDVTF